MRFTYHPVDGDSEAGSATLKAREGLHSATETLRVVVKRGCWICAVVLVSPLLVFHTVKRLLFESDRALQGSSEFISLLPGVGGDYLRRAFLRFTLDRCDANASIGFGTVFTKARARVGRKVHIGSRCQMGWVNIEDDVLIASGVHITSGSKMHGIERIDIPIREQEGVYQEVSIGEGSWIGERAVVMANVGKHCVVGAGAVVVDAIPDYSVAVGVPARVIKDRRETQATGPRP